MEIERLKRLIAAGDLDASRLVGPDAMSVFRFRGILKDELLRSMNRTRQFGVNQVRDELRRQGVAPR